MEAYNPEKFGVQVLLGDVLLRRRVLAGISTRERLSELTGVPTSSIRDLEKGFLSGVSRSEAFQVVKYFKLEEKDERDLIELIMMIPVMHWKTHSASTDSPPRTISADTQPLWLNA